LLSPPERGYRLPALGLGAMYPTALQVQAKTLRGRLTVGVKRSALVTGDAGFVGGAMRKALAARGWETVGVDVKRPCHWADARDYFRGADERFDLVVHCAAVVGGRQLIEGSPLSLAVDLSIDAELFGWAVRTKPGRIVYYSSSAAYPTHLQYGADGYRLAERHIDLSDLDGAPDLTYGWAKLTGEMLAERARAAGVPVTVLRPFSGYGEAQDLSYPFPAIAQRVLRQENPLTVWGDGTQVRDWVHIDDVVGMTLACIDQEVDGPLNICTGMPTSFLRLAHLMAQAAGYAPEIRPVESMPSGVEWRVGDPTKSHRIYAPTVSLSDGIDRMLAAGVRA